MDGARNGAPRANTVDIKRANDTASIVSSLLSMYQSPATNGFLISQKLAMEGVRFWARRMRAYADQLEMFARSTSPEQVAAAQSHFIERLQDDYAKETETVSQIAAKPRSGRQESGQADA